MKGEVDDTVSGRLDSGGDEEAEQDAANAGLPGGKVLLRLLQILEREGLDEVAVETVAMAVPGEDQGQLTRVLEGFTSSPTGDTAAATAEARDAVLSRDSAGSQEENLAKAITDAAEAMGPPTAIGPQWRSLGPWTIPNGQTYGSSRVNVSGRVSSVAVDPANPAHVLVGAAQGGVWESFNRGISWAPRTDYKATLTVGAVVFDPTDSRTVYCGTGEGNFYSWLGAGILRSTDGGSTWSTLCTAPFVGQGFYELVIDRADRRHLLAGTTHGLYVSADGGVTWTRRRTIRTWSISMAPAGGAAAEILGACRDGLHQSTDGGTGWNAIALPSAPGTFDRLEVAIAPSNPDVAYAWGAAGTSAYLWRRANGTWTAVGTPPGVRVNQAWYDWFLAVSPDRDNQIYCGAIEVHRGDLAGTVWTWRNLSNKGATGQSIHPDQHAIAFEPSAPDTIYIGNDGGLFRSADRGITWQHCNNGLVISEFEYLGQDHGSSRWLVGGTQDNGTQRWTGPSTMEHVADGDGGDCGVNRTNPNTVFHTYYNMTPQRSTTRGSFGTWTDIFPPVPTGEGSLFYPPFETSSTTGDTIAMGGDSLYISRNNGTAWTRLAFPSTARSSALYIPGPDDVYVGTTNGGVFHSHWGGTSWGTLTALASPRANAYISDLHVRPGGNRIWATSTTLNGGRVFRSDDAGATWTDLSAGLPPLPINAIEVDPGNTNRIWVAADVGVSQSLNAGASWADFSNALPNSMIGDLMFHPHARVLRAGTRNRGIWEIPVDGWQTQPQNGTQFTGSLAANESRRWFTFNWPATWHIIWTIMPVTPRRGSPQVNWTVQVERATAEYVTYWITVRNLTPAPLTFEGRYSILSRY
ncbi:hypothetical protein FBY31_1721 [Arthrobacter sp. SLBN-100]|uniref:WD40/YVTN/BNR-like repeat-containing protein n=1 Tax=Arthrobacter sp. SLBN-100 TaxID=2768450 RepID=UPI00114E9673|nr:hypothetical protein [Arthrobacter sp. SLBN-100]TQJ67647.1 hypothetical protein FBY31_1721 [Arthrobacter sp. SLBN-100]